MDETLIPAIQDWQLEILQRNGRSFLLAAYEEKRLIGCVLGERIITFKFDKQPKLSYRLLRWLRDDEPQHCCICQQDKHDGWQWQQDISYFICAGCSMKN